jgi:hypothetical protein
MVEGGRQNSNLVTMENRLDVTFRAGGASPIPHRLSPSLILNRARERRWLISGISAFHSEELNVRSDLKGVTWASEKQPLKHANSVPLFRRILG